MQDLLWRNFVISVWVLIGFCALNAIAMTGKVAWLHQAYGPFAGRVIMWPFAVGSIELLLWFRPFRHRESGARLMAGFMGVMLLLKPVFVALIVSDLYDREIDMLSWWIYLYVAISHLAFAFGGATRD